MATRINSCESESNLHHCFRCFVPMRALQFVLESLANRACCLFRAAETRSRIALPISLYLIRTAAAFAFQIAEVTARARIHRRDQHEFAREGHAAGCSRNGNPSILERLPTHTTTRGAI